MRQLRRRVGRQIAQEQELLVHPAFFAALPARCPRVSRLRLEPARGRFNNELTRFRFDVTLEIDTSSAAGATTMACWSDGMDLDTIRRHLSDEKPSTLGYRTVPNRRVQIDTCLANRLRGESSVATAGELRQQRQ